MVMNRIQVSFRRLIPRLVAMSVIIALLVSGCGSSSDAEEPVSSDIGLSVSSGTFTTTVKAAGVTTVPFSETVVVEAVFDEPIYGAAGQTSVFAKASPISYRIGPRPRRNDRTFTFSLTNRSPGTVEVSVYENRDAEPVTFELQIGEE